jgi:hypothetical protein
VGETTLASLCNGVAREQPKKKEKKRKGGPNGRSVTEPQKTQNKTKKSIRRWEWEGVVVVSMGLEKEKIFIIGIRSFGCFLISRCKNPSCALSCAFEMAKSS